MPTTLPERRDAPKPIPSPHPRPEGFALCALIGFGVLSVALVWTTPAMIYLAARLMTEPGEGERLLAYARFYSIQFTPAIGFVTVAFCLYSYYRHRPAHLYAIGAIWLAIGAWHFLLYRLAN